jgi:plastocyanin
MHRALRWGAVPIGLVLALSASSATLASHTRAASQTFTINVDGTPKNANEGFDAYFPRAITIHAGDTVHFHWAGKGEPHTTTFGTLVNNAMNVFNSLTPAQQQANTPPKAMIAADAALPQLLPEGPGDAVQSAANPCYQQSGSVGSDVCPNSQHEQPAFNGTQVYYNSGWADSGQNWSIDFSSSTSPGTYRFMCLLHREGMAGKVTVAPASKTIMSPAAQYALGVKQLAKLAAQLTPALAPTRQGKAPVPGLTIPGANPVLAGSGLPNAEGAILEFGPKNVKIPVGGSVTWYVIGDHSITFHSTHANDDVRQVAPDGTVHLNSAALAPAGGPGQPGGGGGGGGGNSKNITFKVVASQSWNGQGFHNSGLFFSEPPAIQGYKLTFTKAGVYHYICVVHDDMKGTVVVGG